MRSVAVLFALGALMISPSGAAPQQVASFEGAGTAQIRGRVIADDGRPVRRAPLALSGLPDSQLKAGADRIHISRRVESDADGRFTFDGLPAGWYRVIAHPLNGLVPYSGSREVTLTDGLTVDLTIRAQRTGAIAGRIQNKHGDRLLGLKVHAVRRTLVGTHETLTNAGPEATTDDLGEYRLFNLTPGEYYVVATAGRDLAPTATASGDGHAETYFPGSRSITTAKTVVVRPGRDSAGINFRQVPVRLASLAVRPRDSAGRPLGRQSQISLTRLDRPYLSSSFTSASLRTDGTAHFTRLTPGDYVLVVSTGAELDEAAYVNVTLGEEDATLEVQTNTGATISGRVLVDGQPAGTGAQTSRSIWVSSGPPPGTVGPTYARPQSLRGVPSDRFVLTGLRGPMMLSAELGGGALVSIQRDGNELAGETLNLQGTEVIEGVVISLTTQVAELEVSVTDTNARDEPTPVLVVLFPEDPGLWKRGYLAYGHTAASRRLDSASPYRISPVRLSRIPPGPYLVASIPDVGLSDPTSMGVLTQLRSVAVPVTLHAGARAKVSIPVARLRGR